METIKLQRGIIGIATVLSVGVFSLGLALASTMTTLSQLATSRDTSKALATFNASEGNLEEATFQYLHDDSYTGSLPPLLNQTTNGSVGVNSSEWPLIKISSVAGNGSTEHQLVQYIDVFPEGKAFDNAVYSNNTLDLSGNATVNGSVYTNSDLTFTGNSSEINGDAYSSSPITDTDNINGSLVDNVVAVPPPQLDFNFYKTEAQSEGKYFTSDTPAENLLNNQTTVGHVYVLHGGTTKIQGNNTDHTGSLVVDGDLEISGGTFTADLNHVAIAVNGDLRISGGATINGIVYVTGDTSFGAGNNVINGSLISTSGTADSSLSGSLTINYEPSYIGDWKNLGGLTLVSAEPPRIDSWGTQ